MSTILVTLPDPIPGVGGEPIVEIELAAPVGRHFRALEKMGNFGREGRENSSILDCALVLSVSPALTPAMVDGLSWADIRAIDDALGPFFERGSTATGAAE